MFRNILLFNLFTYAVVSVSGTEFPKYIKHCNLQKSDLDDCLTEQANNMIANIQYGDENLGTQSFSPLKVLPTIVYKPNTNFEIELKDCTSTGIKTFKIKSMKMDTKFQTLEFFSLPGNYSWDCSYKASGKLLRENFDDVGRVDIKYDHMKIEYSADYNLKEINGTTYYNVENAICNFKDYSISSNMRNLDRNVYMQADKLNEVWNENPSYFNKKFIPEVQVYGSEVITDFINKVFSGIPADQLFEN